MAIPVSVPLTIAERLHLLEQCWRVQDAAAPVADDAQAARVRASLSRLARDERLYDGPRHFRPAAPGKQIPPGDGLPLPSRTAMHESGHCIAALAQGVIVLDANVWHKGRMHHRPCAPRPNAVISWAGGESECLCVGTEPVVRAYMSAADIEGVRQSAWQQRRGDDRDAWAAARRLEARAVLRRHWRAVLALGRELDRHGKLPGDVIHRIFEAHKGK